ncbi:ORT1 [Candida pseudojiufengensis]|uniref:ORT1 n=1 Tax=Candida pseudojiufengensis TaxID=497109 RepID=UPI00222515F3|nr:ORT1 [Candida pseudojiufengensis]KAI5965168.1 ORT1 [Candida pseudojiufengensis]
MDNDTQHSQNEKLHPIKEITFGAISGMIGKLIEFPFDTIKVRLQSTNENHISTLKMIRLTFKKEGIMGFYKGLKAPLFGACLETSILFTGYNFAMNQFENKSSLVNKCIAGGISGFMVSFILTPIELVKCQLQVVNMQQGNKQINHSYSSIIKNILQKNGVLGLWNGLNSTLTREVVGTSIWFGTYEFLIEEFNKSKHPIIKNKDLQLLTSGAIAGIMFNFLMFPIDTIKSNIQTNDILNKSHHNHHQTTDFYKELRKLMIKKGGIMNLYNGLGITMIRCIPANALIFYTYEILKRNF